jgi:hypothetical protein
VCLFVGCLFLIDVAKVLCSLVCRGLYPLWHCLGVMVFWCILVYLVDMSHRGGADV